MKKQLTLSLATLALVGSLQASDTEKYAELEAKVNALLEEVESMKTSEADEGLSSHHGHGDAMSKAYKNKSKDKLSIGGYGHTNYVNQLDAKSATANNYRNILYIGYRFSDNIIFNSEIEIEHANSVAMEFSAMDFLVNDTVNFRAGNFLIPIGNINLRHEPTLFLNASRPETERQIIPSTWSENGVMVYGSFGNLEYTLSATASLDANNSATIRGMRAGASKSRINDYGYTARLAYKPMEGLDIISSIFYGQTDQGDANLQGTDITIAEAHVLYNANNINFTALYAVSIKGGADILAQAHGANAASKTTGYYATLGYIMKEWTPFVHIESYDLFKDGYNAAGNSVNIDKVTKLTSIGINYRPQKMVVIKAEYLNQTVAGVDDDRLSTSIGYIF